MTAVHPVGPAARPRPRLRSVRVRLLLLVLLPACGLVALAAVQARVSLAATVDAGRGVVMADASTATADLVHELERELAETAGLRDRGGSAGAALVQAQRARTDHAVLRFQRAMSAARSLATDSRLAGTQLARLARARAVAPPSQGGDGGWEAVYREIASALVYVGRALPGQLDDRDLAERARAIAEVTAAAHAVAQQRDLLRLVLTRKQYAPGDRAALAGLVAEERERRAAFLVSAGPDARALWDRTVRGADVDALAGIREAALAADPNLLAADPDAWYVAATHTIRLMHEVQLDLAASLHRAAAGVRAAARRAAFAVVGGSGVVLLVTLTVAAVLLTRIGRRLRRLRDIALAVAGKDLPAAIEAVGSAADPAAVHRARLAAGAAVGEHDGADSRGDEIAEVGQSLAKLHRQALQLATAQALLRLDTAAVFLALARRNQNLVQRQLTAIDDLERTETDPDRLSALYTVDHLAARMRRNSENLLVLAGSEPGRRFITAQSLLDVVRAAAAEIADYARVDPIDLGSVGVAGPAVGDLVHLLAELLENATTFSDPQSRVRVTARPAADCVVVAVHDEGMGIGPDDLAAANQRLATRTGLTASVAATMGLLVVAHLAARHGVEVELRSRLGGGTVARVNIPNALLVSWQDGVPTGAVPLRSPLSGRRRSAGVAPVRGRPAVTG